jgi:LPS O-antigen subunit length determinant protein (WzzB/FepE family)
MIELKKELYQKCLVYVQNRLEAAKQALDDAQAAAKDETKSSAGDKYETTREMIQQETDRNMAQLNEANKLKVALSTIVTGGNSETAEPGSLVITDNGSFYLAISAGMISVNNEKYYAVSPASPIGQKLKGLKSGNKFTLNDKSYLIEHVI